MYNLKNLNDYEFEILCKSIMSKILNKKLYRFPRGKDGGIDLCDDIEEPQIVIQVKHYSNFSSLKNKLLSEVENVKELKCKDYYICISLELTQNQKNQVYEIFKLYMSSINNIIDGIIINDFLEEPTNTDIVKKNYKLWLNATNVLELINNRHIFIDCEELVDDIQSKVKYYVETQIYTKALNKIKKENIIIILGAPGVGKSTISKMIILKYVVDGFKVRYTTDNNIVDIKKSITLNPEEKEIILLDDFLGQHYLNLKETTPNEIKSLLSFIRKNKNKKIILNSRITILNEARNRNRIFDDLIEEYDFNKYVINVQELSNLEKGKIFYNHLYFNKLPECKFENIKNNKKYLHIINHKNYNPRIIEYVTRPSRYKNINDSDYYNYIIKNLDNPQDVWKDEFDNRISNVDREFMYILYSLTNTYIEKEKIKEAYNERVKKINIDMSVNTFEQTMRRLSDSLIKKVCEDGKIKIAVESISINDYMKNELQENELLLKNIVNSAVYIEQILKFEHHEFVQEILKEKIKSGDFLKYKCLEKNIFLYYIEEICKYNINSLECNEFIKLAFERCYENIKNDNSRVEYNCAIRKFIENNNYISCIKNILSDSVRMKFLMRKMDSETLEDIYDILTQNYKENEYQNVFEILKERLIEELKYDLESDLEYIINDIIDGEVEQGLKFNKDIKSEDIYPLIRTKIDDEIEEKIEQIVDLGPEFLELNIEMFDVDEIIEELNVWETIDYTIELFNMEDFEEERLSFSEENLENIFEREYVNEGE